MPKLEADLAAGTAQYDFFCNDIEFQYTIYPSLLPINDLIAERGYDMEGFFEPIYTYGKELPVGRKGALRAADARRRLVGLLPDRPHRRVPHDLG